MEIGQDVAGIADDDAGAQAGGALGAAVEAIAKKVAEDRILQQGVPGRPDFLRGVDVHHGRQGLACRFTVSGRLTRAVVRGRVRFVQGHHRRPLPRKPFGLEGGDDEQGGQQNRHRLCKNQPQPLHGRPER